MKYLLAIFLSATAMAQIVNGGGGGGGTPGGSTTQVQTNIGSAFSGDASFTHSNVTNETDIANDAAIRYVTPYWNWSYTDVAGSLGNLTSAGTNLTLTLPCTSGSPCPRGLDTTFGAFPPGGTVTINSGTAIVTNSGNNFFTNYVGLPVSIPGAGPAGATLVSNIVSWQSPTQVTIAINASTTVTNGSMTIASYYYPIYISGTGTAEAVPVLGGNCAPLATSPCTLIVSTVNAHPNGYTVSSASNGIQEAINDGWSGENANSVPNVKLVANLEYPIRATYYLRAPTSTFDGKGGIVSCYTRDYCMFGGYWKGHPGQVNGQTIRDVFMAPRIVVTGCSGNTYCNVSSISAASGVVTVTTSANHTFNGPTNGIGADTVFCEIHSTGLGMFRFVSRIQAVTANTFTVALDSAGTFSAGVYTFGFCRVYEVGLEVNGNHTEVYDFQTQLWTFGQTFTFVIGNENDQHLMIRGFSTRGSPVTDQTFPISAALFQRTDHTYAGIYNITDAEVGGNNCYNGGGNGMKWNGGVCQAFATFGIRYFGGLQPTTIQDVYQEASSAVNNPLYGYGASMSYLLQGTIRPRILGTFPISSVYPTFACSAGGAQAQRNYYVIPWNGSVQAGPMLYVGSSSAANCSGVNVPVVWPSIEGVDASSFSVGTVTWSMLVTSGAGTLPPFGSVTGTATSGFILGTGSAGSSAPVCGSNGMCSWTDTQASGTSGTVPSPAFPPLFWFWPSPFVNNGTVILTDETGDPPAEVSSNGAAKVSMIGLHCAASVSAERASPVLTQCLGIDPSLGPNAMTLTQLNTAGTSPTAGSKGVFNFGPTLSNINDVLTLGDSNFTKTIINGSGRPAADAADIAIGQDSANGLSERAPTSISQYINVVQDNSSFKERLTSTLKTFNVPIAQQSVTFATLPGSPANGWRVYCSDCTVTTPGSCTNITTAAACTCAGSGNGAEAKRINGAWLCQ